MVCVACAFLLCYHQKYLYVVIPIVEHAVYGDSDTKLVMECLEMEEVIFLRVIEAI